MITNAVMTLFYTIIWIFTFPIRLLPDASFPQFLNDFLLTASKFLATIDIFVSIEDVKTFVIAILAVEAAIMIVKIFNFFLHLLPTK